MSYMQIISSCLYVRLKRSLFTRWLSTFKTPVIKLIKYNVNVNYLKIPKKHSGPRAWDPWPTVLSRGGEPVARVNIWYGPHQNFRYPS